MMRSKPLLIGIGVLVVLIGVYFLVEMNAETTLSVSAVMLQVDTLKTDKVTIIKKNSNVTLEKANGQWHAKDSTGSFKADSSLVLELLRTCAEVKVNAVTSTNPEKFGQFQLDSLGTTYTFYVGGKESGSIVTGKASQAGGTYARLPKGKQSVMVQTTFSRYNYRRMSDWRDKFICRTDAALVMSAEVHGPEVDYKLTRNGAAWTATDLATGMTYQADSANAMQTINFLSSLRASTFATPSEIDSTKGQPPVLRVEITGATGPLAKMSGALKPGDDNRYFCTKDGDPSVFVLYKSSVTRFLKKAGDFQTPVPPPQPPQGRGMPGGMMPPGMMGGQGMPMNFGK